MINRLGVLFLLVSAAAASPLFAGDAAIMKCDASQDRVWVYDSLKTFDVAAKLQCGETVEIAGRVKGYVKIRAANGTVGWVPDSTFPDLPPFVDPNDSQSPISLAARIAPRAAHTADANRPSAPVASTRAPVPVSTPAPAPAPTPAAAPTNSASVASIPNPPRAETVARVPVRPVVAAAPAPVSSVRNVSEISAPAAAPAAAAEPAAPSAIETSRATPAPSAARKPNPARSATTKSQPAPAATSHAPALTSTSAKSSSRSSSPSASGRLANSKSAGAQPQPSGGAHPAPTPSVPTPAASSPAASESTASLQPPPVEVASVHTVAATESDEYPEDQPENESADPACRTFFSAYGLSPAQFKWIAQNRKKQFSSICPAPDLSRVDFVIIFTHDVDFFGSTLPAVVHTDHNGFSDFSPMSTIDTALVPQSEWDKAHREYVWVFRMHRGSFDPAKFSPRRRPQFSKAESHAPARTVEEAFRFIESGGAGE